MKKLILIMIVLLTGCLFGCKDSLDDETFAAYDEQPVGIWLEQQPEYSEWVSLLKRTDLYNALNVNMDFTCFVADNDAVAGYLQEKGYASVDEIPLSEASYLMRYHIIPGNAYKQSALSGQLIDTTASGDYLTVKYRDGGVNAMYVNDTALIVRKDIEVINGYLHQLNRVLDPITRTVWDVLETTDNYSIFREAVRECGLQDWLSTRIKVSGEVSVRDYKTLFVVSDETFGANGIASLTDLHQKYPGDATDESSKFYQYVAYHIINSNSDFADLATFSDDASEKAKNISTKAGMELIQIEELDELQTAEEKVVINRSTDSIHFVVGKYDLQCMNGFVHEVDKLMEPQAPRPTVVTFDFCDIDACRKLEGYGNTSLANQTNFALDRETAEDIEWYTVPDNDEAIRYQIRTDQSWNKPSQDLLMMNLGYVGWVKIKTPVIAKGTYKMTIYKFAYSSVRGICQMYVDDKVAGTQLDFSGSGKNTMDLGTVVFTETNQHIIKFSAIKKGVMEVDRIVFTPVFE